MPASFGEREAAQNLEISGWVSGAQSAFNAALARVDLGPNGLPWGTTPDQSALGRPPLNITWPGAGPNPGANGAPFAPGSVNTPAGGMSVTNPRVVDFPHCSPITTAARREALVEAEGCGNGTVSGNFVSTFNSAAYPTEPQLRQPVQAQTTGMGDCGNPMVCAGNPAYYTGVANAMAPGANSNSPYPGQSPSPADWARMNQSLFQSAYESRVPWWVWVAGAVAIVKFTR